MKRILILFAIFLCSLTAMANGVEIDGIHYILDNDNHTACVTYTGDFLYDNTYSGYITIPDSINFEGTWHHVTSIGDQAFMYCSQLFSVSISENVTSIGTAAFANCSNLSFIYIPRGVTDIESYAFQNCYGLTGFDIPENVTYIGSNAFMGCSRLYSVSFPKDIFYIGSEAFSGCTFLQQISCMALFPPFCDYMAFDDVPRNIPLYVPSSAVDAYISADQWGEFDVQPFLVEIAPITPNAIDLIWEPVGAASLYQLHIYTDSTVAILDTTLFVDADNLSGGIMQQLRTTKVRYVSKIVQDAGGTIIVITIDPTSGSSMENPYKVTVSTASGERIDVHFEMTVFSGTEVILEDYGTFVLNEAVVPSGFEKTLVPSLPIGIYDLYGHRYTAEMWENLPAGVYVVREEDRVEKVMKK